MRPKAPKDSLTQCRRAVFPPCAFLISLAVNLQRNSSVGGWSPGSSVFQPWQSKFLFLQVPFLEKLSRAAQGTGRTGLPTTRTCILKTFMWSVCTSLYPFWLSCGLFRCFVCVSHSAKANPHVVFLKASQNAVCKSALPAFLVCWFLSFPFLPSMLSHSQSIIH